MLRQSLAVPIVFGPARGLPRAQIALAWLLHKPAVTAPIVGASKPQHLEDAVAALSVTLSDDEIAALEAPYVAHAVAGHPSNLPSTCTTGTPREAR